MVSMAVIVAYGVRADGIREVLGVDVGPSEDVTVWRTFLQGLVARDVRGVKLVTSDAHPGLKQAIAEVFVGAAWMSCRVHFMRNVLARVSKSAQAMLTATVLVEEAESEVLTFYDFPTEHRRQVYSTNPLGRLNKELKRRSAGVGIFPNRQAVLRLFCALLAEQNDEWLVGQHRSFSEAAMAKILNPKEESAAA